MLSDIGANIYDDGEGIVTDPYFNSYANDFEPTFSFPGISTSLVPPNGQLDLGYSSAARGAGFSLHHTASAGVAGHHYHAAHSQH